MKDQTQLSAEWYRLARRTVRKVNLGWWLDRLEPLLITLGVAGFAVLFWLRSRGAVLELQMIWPWLAGALVCITVAAWLWARKEFMTLPQALVRLDSELNLHNALTTAHAGHGSWPAIPSQIQDGWQWRWQHVGGPAALCFGALAAALWMPITPKAVAALPNVEPQSWAQMEEWLQTLEEEKIITPEEKEEESAKIAELRQQPQNKWFSHESLNASDTLKEQLQHDMQKLGQHLNNAERSLNALQKGGDQISQAAKDQLLKHFDEALSGLQASPLNLDPALLKELAQADPKNLNKFSPEQLDKLRESLKNKAGVCNGNGKSPGFLGDGEGEDDELAAILGLLREQEGDGMPGNGGIDRGPGSAPLTLSEQENRFDTNRNEAVSNTDLQNAQLGDMLAVQNGKHEVEKNASSIQAAGQVQSTGAGGEQVWKEALTPEEKAILKRVFQ